MAANRSDGARLVYLDNLKWVLIAAVIVSHAATAYAAIGGWLYTEPSLSSLTKAIFSVLTEVGDLFALGTFMLVAGLLTPASLAHKGSAKFVRDRLVRLGAPVLLTVAVVTPLLVWMIVVVTGYQLTLASYAQWQLRWLEPGPMWFPAVLLLFTLCYAAWRWLRPVAPRKTDAPLRMRHLLVGAGLIAALSFLVRFAFPIGSQQPLELHLWQWPQLAVLFGFGVLAGERGWLAGRLSRPIRRVVWTAAPVAIVILFGLVALSGADVKSASGMALFSGGWYWQSALAATGEGVIAVSGSLVLIDLFRQVANWHGRLARALSRDSYGAFFLQLPVLVLLELAIRRVAWPGEVKLALTAPAAVAICFALAWAARRAWPSIRGLGRMRASGSSAEGGLQLQP